jgi:hypothetical protein
LQKCGAPSWLLLRVTPVAACSQQHQAQAIVRYIWGYTSGQGAACLP